MLKVTDDGKLRRWKLGTRGTGVHRPTDDVTKWGIME